VPRSRAEANARIQGARSQRLEAEAKLATEWIRAGLVAAEKQRNATQGRALLRRLNRIEYNNTINDLLGTDIKLLDRLPQDGSAFGFDTVDVGLDMAGPTLERYIQAADVALDAALAHGPRPSTIDPAAITGIFTASTT